MPSPFVWFDNIGAKRADTTTFLENAFGWASNDIGPMTFLTAEGKEMPFAATADVTANAAADAMADVSGWVPYVEVEDLGKAVANAQKHGARIIAENLQGPAGTASFIRDPGGAALALWKRAANM